MVDKLCLLAQSSCLSGLLLGGTSIGPVICFPFSFVQKKGFVFEKKERLCFPFVVSVCSLYTSNMSSHLVLLFMQVETIRLTEPLSCTSQELLRCVLFSLVLLASSEDWFSHYFSYTYVQSHSLNEQQAQ